MKIFVCGYPRAIGGADTELWHVLRLWRRFNVKVHLLSTIRPPARWRRQCEHMGFQTTRIGGPRWSTSVPDLQGATVVAFCNSDFLRYAPILRQLGCRLVWGNCMTYNFPDELSLCESIGPFDAYIFQSEFQRSELFPQLQELGVQASQCHHIPGALDFGDFSYKPRVHRQGAPFVIGRLARNDPDKWHPNTWSIFANVQYRPLHARVMGWCRKVEAKLGSPPPWADVLSPCQETSAIFYRSLHALVSINGGARENWPRIGLEAMAAGVPVVAENAWGWKEMIVHGETGLLASNEAEFSTCTDALARNGDLRRSIVHRARARLQDELASPSRIWMAWQALFNSVL